MLWVEDKQELNCTDVAVALLVLFKGRFCVFTPSSKHCKRMVHDTLVKKHWSVTSVLCFLGDLLVLGLD